MAQKIFLFFALTFGLLVVFNRENFLTPAQAAPQKVCFCHNVLHNPVTICTADQGLIQGHLGHVRNGEDTLGACLVSPSPTVSPTGSPLPTSTASPTSSPTASPSATAFPTASPSSYPSNTPFPSAIPPVGGGNICTITNNVSSNSSTGGNSSSFNTGGSSLVLSEGAVNNTTIYNQACINNLNINGGNSTPTSNQISGNGAGSINSIIISISNFLSISQ
jgi:hypothetical protein